jgi:hypothetical protein
MGNGRPLTWQPKHRNNNRQKIIDYKLSLLFFVQITVLRYLTTQRNRDGQAGNSDLAVCNPISDTSFACAGVSGMPILKANAPKVNTLARYFFITFSL